ncbi:trypsin-like peptidase domain-containing protein [Acetobacteraceae bacterium H6797]|nr:trypsin-like peptidase domain-containing protein [Acetobacteraceae bacterium H6797]
MRHASLSLLIASLLITAPAFSQSPPASQNQEPQRVRVLNRTGQTAEALYAPRHARPDWGNNLLRGPLANEDGFNLRTAPTAGCRFDFRMTLADGREAVVRDTDICVAKEIAITPGNIGASTARSGAEGVAPSGPSARPNPQARGASGTGFVVATDTVMTNHHVIDGCSRILVRRSDKRFIEAVPPAKVDRDLDLAMIKVPNLGLAPLAFRSAPPLRRGDGVIAFGFPLAGLLSSDPKLTRGELNGLNGLGDNPNQYQISAEVQPGNSGGPLLDMYGRVVGVVVAKLNAQSVARRTGDIAQNVNFAIKGEQAMNFMRRAGLEPRVSESRGTEMSAADVGDVADESTVFIRCEK